MIAALFATPERSAGAVESMSFKPYERDSKPLSHAVSDSLNDYFRTLNGHAPENLYDVILAQVEPPLLRATLAYCRGNQSKAADMLGLNRATLRKKLGQYKISAKAATGASAAAAKTETFSERRL